MSFTVRKIEDPAIYVRRNIKPDILGISSAWDNIVDIKETLNRLEDDVTAANKRPKLSKNTCSYGGKVLKEISRETQQLGKVTRFQLDKNPSRSDYAASKAKTSYSSVNQGKDGYSPTRYTASASKTGNSVHSERPTYFETSTLHPTILNASPPSKETSFVNTTANTSTSQFSVTSSPAFHGKTVLARNEAALEKIKEKVRRQKAMHSKHEESSEGTLGGARKLHESTDDVAASNKHEDNMDIEPPVVLKRKVGTISASGPTYKGFNAVSEAKQKTVEKPKVQLQPKKDFREKMSSKRPPIQEKKTTKGKVKRIIGAKKPQQVITTTSWRDGQANVKRILNAKKGKASDKPPVKTAKTQARSGKTTAKNDIVSKKADKVPLKNDKASTKTNTTYDVDLQSEDEIEEGRLTSDDDTSDLFSAKIEKFEAEKDVPELNEEILKAREDVSVATDHDDRMKDVLSKEAQSMLADLARDSSESDAEIPKEEKPKASPPRKKILKAKKPAAAQKTSEDVLPKGKTRHYDQAEVQKYMACQLAERKKKEKQDRIQKKKLEEEKQQRLKDLYERQKKSFATSRKDKRLGKTFSFGSFDVHVPSQEYNRKSKVLQSSSLNESDKENTDIDEEEKSHESSSERYTDDADVTLTEDVLTNDTSRPTERVEQAAPSISPSQRAQRLSALQATARALQTRLQSHALRLSSATEVTVPQPAAKIPVQPKETGFQGILPGVANIRKQADETERRSTRAAAATKIQAAYRGHTVRKSSQWQDEKTTSNRDAALTKDYGMPLEHRGVSREHRDMSRKSHVSRELEGISREQPDVPRERRELSREYSGMSRERRDISREHEFEEPESEGSADDIQFTNIRPFFNSERLNNVVESPERKYDELRTRNNFLRNDFSASAVTHFTAAPPRYEPRGDRFSVMNIFSRRHPTLPVEDILNDEPGSETASLLEVGKRKSTEQNVDYEDDFTDAEISTNSALSEGDLKKGASKAETYSECFETDEETKGSPKESPKASHSSSNDGRKQERTPEPERNDHSDSSPISVDDNMLRPVDDNMLRPNHTDDFILPVMASTMQPDTRPSPSISLSEEPIRQRPYINPPDRTGGTRLSPDSLRRKLTAEINLLENVEDAVRQANEIERTRAVSLAQQETVSLAQILKAKQQSHDQEMHNLRLKAREEAIQAGKDLEKTRQAAAMAAASAAERLAEVQTEAIKTNTEHSRKYMEEASRMTTGLLTNTSNKLAEFCQNLATTTSAGIQELHEIRLPTTTLVERATSISEGHATHSEHSSTSSQSKSLESSPPVTSGRQQAGYSSDEFESYKSQTAKTDGSDKKPEGRSSLSPESIAEDLPEKSVTEDDTTVHEESGNDTQDALPRKPSTMAQDSVSSVMDYSSQFDDSSRAPTDDEIDSSYLLPSREHRRNSIKRIKDTSFNDEKGKGKSVRTSFESDDSFGKFTVDMIQQYMHEEHVRTKHQAAILRLREKSLKEKTKAELQWLEQMKKQSRDKGSDDVMPSIKKRERGIRMKLKAEKEEIKCLRAANRAASFQRRFMIYQQQEIQRLHQANLSIRERIQKDHSKKGSNRSSHELSKNQPRTSSPVSKPSTQSTPSSSSKSKTFNQSPSAKSVSEDISEEQEISHASPNSPASPFPSYGSPTTEISKQNTLSPAAHGPQEPETSTILNMLSTVVSGAQGNQNGEQLLKIHKMLLERQEKLAKDESELNSVLQKVKEMLKNQKNLGSISQHSTSHSSQSASVVFDPSKAHSKQSPSAQSIPEDILSVAKTVSEDVKDSAEKTANDYENCTFESDDSTPRSRRSTKVTSQNGEIVDEEEILSLTETSDHSDLEERVRKLTEELHREKMKAEALERKKRKIKRSVMKKEALNLEIELKNTRDDIHRKLAEIKTASAAAHSTVTLHSNAARSSVTPHKTTPLQEVAHPPWDSTATPGSGRTSSGVESSSHEVEESLIEVLDDNENESSKRGLSQLSSTKSEESEIPEQPSANEIEESIGEILDDSPSLDRGVLPDRSANLPIAKEHKTSKKAPSVEDKTEPKGSLPVSKDDSLDIPEEISEHSSRSTTTILEEVPSKTSETPEEISERSYTPIPSDASVSEELLDARTRSKASSLSEKEISEDVRSKVSSVSDEDDTFEHSYTEPKSTVSASKRSPSAKETPDNKTNSFEVLPGSRASPFSISEHLTRQSDDEPSYTEPKSVSLRSHHSDKLRKQDATAVDRNDTRESSRSIPKKELAERDAKAVDRRSEVSDISRSSVSDDEISEKSVTSSKRSRSPADEKSGRPRESSTRELAEVPPIDSELRPANREESPEIAVKTTLVPSPRDLEPNGSHSEALSIAEEIANGYEDISESRSVKGFSVDESGLDKPRWDQKILDQPRLDGFDKLGLNEHTGLDEDETRETGLDRPVIVQPELDETELDKPGITERQVGKSDINQSERTANDVSAKQIEENDDEAGNSLSTEGSRSRELGTRKTEERSENEQQYSVDFETDDASIPEEISEVGEKEENFAMYISCEKTAQNLSGNVSEDSGDRPREVVEESRDVPHDVAEKSHNRPRDIVDEPRAPLIVDIITDKIFQDIVADSLTTIKSLKIVENENLDKQDSRKILCVAFSKATRKLADTEGPLNVTTRQNVHEDTQTDGVPSVHLDAYTSRGASVDELGEKGMGKVEDIKEEIGTQRAKVKHLDTESITKDLLADAIMQMMEIKRRKKENNLKLAAVEQAKPSVEQISHEPETPPEKSSDAAPATGTTSPREVQTPVDDAIDNALQIAKSNQIMDRDALKSMNEDIAGLFGEEDEEEFPVNETNFVDVPSDDNEALQTEFSPMFAVPHTTQELTPMVDLTVDVLLEQKRLGIPLDDCVPQPQFLAGNNDNECASIQSYRHLVFDLTKEVFMDTVAQCEQSTRPPWAKAKWRAGQKLSRNFKRWKSDHEIRTAVQEQVTNLIGLGAPRATMATLPRKTPVRGNKKDNVDAILIEELRQEEPLWTDYEEDETTVKFQVADAILNMLLEDTVRVFNAIQATKHVPDNVLVV